jgi:hypothetical protein
MADTGDRMFCHACGGVWSRADSGLTCPHCESDFTEIVRVPLFLVSLFAVTNGPPHRLKSLQIQTLLLQNSNRNLVRHLSTRGQTTDLGVMRKRLDLGHSTSWIQDLPATLSTPTGPPMAASPLAVLLSVVVSLRGNLPRTALPTPRFR